jgi:hypothetical protein
MFAALVLAAAAALIPAPDAWRQESFDFPLRFAPGIPYEGQEHLRFAPGWDKFTEDSGFSYVILWDVKKVPVEPADLEDHLESYFNGLMSNVARGRQLEPPPRTVVAAHPLAPPRDWQQGFGVDIRTYNAFAKGEPLLLRAEVTQRNCGARMQVFIALSQARRDKAIWDILRRLRAGTACK